MSGKGGVGKSSIASILSCISAEKTNTLLLDFDITGPSITNIFSSNQRVKKAEKGLEAIKIQGNLHVLSMGALIQKTDSVIWRGPKKLSILRMFYESIDKYDRIIIDMPPGLSEEHQFLLDKNVQVVFVTTPQNIALSDTEKTINFCVSNNLQIKGIVENMSGFKCENCNCEINIFAKSGGKLLAEAYNIKYIGSIELNKNICEAIESKEIYKRYHELCEFNFLYELFV